ncbi:beta-lactamase family protein [Yimella sp. cx-573]|nr:beta-lactamase family protein [Yimella sp. cx-573]
MNFPRATAHEVSIDTRGLIEFLDAAEQQSCDLHSLMVSRDGQVIAQGWAAPYSGDQVHLLYSCSKMITATAVGLLVDEGKLDLRDRVLDRLPWWLLKTDRSRVHGWWQDATISHCLSMTLGHDDDAWGRATAGAFDAAWQPADVDWIDLILRTDLDHEPGSTFAYNQVATYLLSRVVSHVSGQSLLGYLRPRLLDPLGIGDVATQTDSADNALGFTGVHATTEALLKLAQLYLNEGRWEGAQLLSADWVRRARTPFGPSNRDPEADPDWDQGYGFSLWNARHGYRGDGAFGQFAIVLPHQRMAIAITAETADMQRILDLLWQHVLPAVDRPGSADSDALLAERLGSMSLLPPRNERSDVLGEVEEVIAGRAGLIEQRRDPYGRSGRFPSHWTGLRLNSTDAGWTATLDSAVLGGFGITIGADDWATSELEFGDRGTLAMTSRGAWETSDRFVADVVAIRTPHRFRLILDRSGSEPTFDLVWRYCPLTGPEPAALAVKVWG